MAGGTCRAVEWAGGAVGKFCQMVGAGDRAAEGTRHAVTSPNRAVGDGCRAGELPDRAGKGFGGTENPLDFAERKPRRAAIEWRRESGGARVATVTSTGVPKDIEVRILIAYQKAVNQFFKFFFRPGEKSILSCA